MLAVAALLVLSASLPDSTSVPHYQLAVRVEPGTHSVAVRGRVEGLPCDGEGGLYLNRSLRIESFSIGGRNVPVRLDSTGSPAPYAPDTRPLRFDCAAGAIELKYRGVLPDTMNGVNLIAGNLVELASYSGWYPMDPAVSNFTYEVDLDLPTGWILATNGRVLRADTANSRQHIVFAAAAPGMDIPIIASPDFVVERAEVDGASVEVYAVQAHRGLAMTAIENTREALTRYRRWFGPAGSAGVETLPTRVVYSPRPGWGYSRLPLITGSAAYAERKQRHAMGAALNFHGIAHEAAHFWWGIADTGTFDDWINEGLAEYSAFSATAEIFGAVVRDSLIAQYIAHSARADSSTAIATTRRESRLRYVNRYERPALLFAAIAADVSSERFHAFLRHFYEMYRGTRDATSTAFLGAARAALGTEIADRIERCVMRPWRADCARPVPAPHEAGGDR